MNIYKQLFFNVIADGDIENENVKDFALYCAERVPEYFWTIPASSSGKYHPATDLGEGGLVRHSLMVYRIAIDLFNTTTERKIADFKDQILFACLFHDCCKNGMENSGHTEHTHPVIASNFIQNCWKEYINKKECTPFPFSYIDDITEMISTHMGKWNTSKYSSIELPTPVLSREKFVHQCDYIASRKYCLFDEEYFNQF